MCSSSSCTTNPFCLSCKLADICKTSSNNRAYDCWYSQMTSLNLIASSFVTCLLKHILSSGTSSVPTGRWWRLNTGRLFGLVFSKPLFDGEVMENDPMNVSNIWKNICKGKVRYALQVLCRNIPEKSNECCCWKGARSIEEETRFVCCQSCRGADMQRKGLRA